MTSLHAENAAPISDDQAAGLRKLLGSQRRAALPLLSVLPAKANEAFLARLGAALHGQGCALRPMDESESWSELREDDVFVALAGDFDSATAAYALVKAAVGSHGKRRFQLIFHGAPERAIVSRFKRVADRFLGIEVRVAGILPRQTTGRAADELAARLCELTPANEE